MGDKANRYRPIAGGGDELEVHRHHLAKSVEHLGEPAQPLHDRMVKACDHAVPIGDPHQVLERQIGPHRLGHLAARQQ